MSLASLLLGDVVKQKSARKAAASKKHVDEDLDTIFRSNPAPLAPSPPSNGKRNPITIPSNPSLASPTSPARGQKRKRPQEVTPVNVETLQATVDRGTPKPQKRKKEYKSVEKLASSSEDEEDDAQLEDDYLNRRTLQKVTIEGDIPTVHESSEEDDENVEPPVHETHTDAPATKSRQKSRKKTKYVPPDETPAQRDARTIFVGNIPIDVAKSKSSQKQLKRHFLSHIPGSKIESMRFRSVAFATATSELPNEDTTATAKPTRGGSKPEPPSTKQQRQQERAAQWRANEADETSDREDVSRKPDSAFRNPGEKKRIAFIRREFHQEVDTVNAYVVFAHEAPGVAGEEKATVHAAEVARLAVERCDGTAFLDRTIRVDRVGQWRAGAVAGEDALSAAGDPRKTLFVGNLDFAAKEEELRVWFEGVMSQERGPPGEGSDNDGDRDGDGDVGMERQKAWVRSVRIVRDRDTQLGKGFAYVRFADRDCVDEILGLEADKLKFAKRKLRVQRCKVVPPGGSTPSKPKPKPASTSKGSGSIAKAAACAPAPMPKGDPNLGAKLAGLSKDQRKAAKASNVDRVQRRLAKKKVKAGVEKAMEKSGAKVRERERKVGGSKQKVKAKVVNKGRVRSEKSAGKRNMKK